MFLERVVNMDADNNTNNNDNTDNLTDDQMIDVFVHGIMDEKGVEAPTEEIKQNIFTDLKNRLLGEIDRSLIAELPDDKIDQLNQMVTEGKEIDPQLIAQMIKEANLDVAEITSVTMNHFRDVYLGNTSAQSTNANNDIKE